MRWVQALLRPVSAGGLLGALAIGLLGFAPISEERERPESTVIVIEISSYDVVDDDDGEAATSLEYAPVTSDVIFHPSGVESVILVDVRSRGPPPRSLFV